MNLYDKASLILTPNAYKASKIYVAKPTDGSGDLTFSRASAAMRRNSAGLWESVASGMPRLHYPVGGGCPSWLFEPQRTNVVLYSTDFSNAAWVNYTTCTKAPSALPTNIVGVTPYDIVLNGSTLLQTVGDQTGDTVYQVFIRATDPSDVGKTVRLANNGTLTVTITLTNSWQEFSCKNNGTGNLIQIIDGVVNPAGRFTVSYMGVESGSTATSPIITQGATVTRTADVIPVFNVSSFIGASAGTFFIDLTSVAQGQSNGNLNYFLSASSDGISGDGFWIRNDVTSSVRLKIFKRMSGANSQIYQLLADRSKIAITWDGTNACVHVNGALVVADFAFTATALHYFNLNPNVIQETKDIMFFPTRPTVAELNALTTI